MKLFHHIKNPSRMDHRLITFVEEEDDQERFAVTRTTNNPRLGEKNRDPRNERGVDNLAEVVDRTVRGLGLQENVLRVVCRHPHGWRLNEPGELEAASAKNTDRYVRLMPIAYASSFNIGLRSSSNLPHLRSYLSSSGRTSVCPKTPCGINQCSLQPDVWR